MAIRRVQFADTDVRVSSLCLGTMMFGNRTNENESIQIMHRALDGGIDFWDTASMYTETLTETIVGKALKGRRNRVFLATKVHQGVTYKDFIESCNASLKRLGTDRVDLLQVHWPKEAMSLEEITRALDDLVKAGKVRYIGCCNFPAWVLARARELSAVTNRARMISFQPPYNLIERGIEVELLPMCLHEKIAVIPYRPLCIGLLAGKYRPGQPVPSDSRAQTDERVVKMLQKYSAGIEALLRFAEEHRARPAAVALAWVRAQPAITAPIVGVSRMNQLEELIQDASYELDAKQCEELAKPFDSEVKEEALGGFPPWRRNLSVLSR
jgi:1-deoxyxylulose-5-phosphate synthase